MCTLPGDRLTDRDAEGEALLFQQCDRGVSVATKRKGASCCIAATKGTGRCRYGVVLVVRRKACPRRQIQVQNSLFRNDAQLAEFKHTRHSTTVGEVCGPGTVFAAALDTTPPDDQIQPSLESVPTSCNRVRARIIAEDSHQLRRRG
jgi:hypothetical protein